MILKQYQYTNQNLTKLHSEISSSATVQNFTGLTGSSEFIEVNGDSLLDEAALDLVISSHVPQTQKEYDFIKYTKRSEVKNQIIAEMASENMERVRGGIWTVQQLIGLTQDAELKNVLNDINTLSFELAVGKLQAATNPLLTTEIKNQWVAKLASHFYN